MAKGKRVSNKPGGDPGSRARKTGDRHYQNVQRRAAFVGLERAKLLSPVGYAQSRAKRVPGPSLVGRIVGPIKRFFRSR